MAPSKLPRWRPHLYFQTFRVVFQGLASLGQDRRQPPSADWRCRGNLRETKFRRNSMGFQHLAGAAYRALTARKDGPSLYDVCDPLLLHPTGGDPHLAKFYRTALSNPALRPLLRRAGLPELREPSRLGALREAITRARDDANP